MLLLLVAAVEAVAAMRVAARMVHTIGGRPLAAAGTPFAGTIDVVVPTLDEERRVGAALAALAACGPEVGAILVVDGGSRDGTATVVANAALADPRIRFVPAGPPPDGWNGKAWNLAVGLEHTTAPWFATVDADVRIGANLLRAAAERAEHGALAALSVATRQELADGGAALLHPAFLTTLVYRGGLPNVAVGDPAGVQANGQVFLARRDALTASRAFEAARASRCEDITTARVLAANGGRVGFYEGDAVVRMHDSWRDCAANWPRSLTLRDGFVSARRMWLGLGETAFAQALPLPTLVVAGLLHDAPAFAVAFALVAMRLGVLAGTRRAYVRPPLWYWLSPLADSPALVLIAASALRRRHVWRGRVLVAAPGERA